MVTKPSERIVWVDCEMTGVDPFNDLLLEVAVVVTDSDLAPVDPGFEVVIATSEADLERMSPFVKKMHLKSGLFERLPHGVPLEQAQQQVVEYLTRVLGSGSKPPLAGNSVGTDKTFLLRYMPEVMKLLHYRIIDVSSLKELAKRWYPRVYYASPIKQGGHRALADILESIDEMRYYQQTLFRDPQTVPSNEARKVASRIAKFSVSGTISTADSPKPYRP